jgi:hypothetical protein
MEPVLGVAAVCLKVQCHLRMNEFPGETHVAGLSLRTGSIPLRHGPHVMHLQGGSGWDGLQASGAGHHGAG